MKKQAPFLFAITAIFFFTGCAFLHTPSRARALSLIEIRTGDGESEITLAPGEAVELKATGIGPDGEEVSISPVWNAEIGTLNPEDGERVMYTVPEDAETGLVFVKASTNGTSDVIIIEIQR